MHTHPRLVRYLPLSLAATFSVLVLPALLAARLLPPSGAWSTLASGVLAVVASLSIATLEAAAWNAFRRRSDLVFADLMLWGLARRWWMERRLDRLSTSYERAARADLTVRVELLEAIARLLEARSPYTYGHCRRVAQHSERIARALHLTPAEVATIRTAALVHDVGKLYTPPELLQKAGPLSDAERAVLARHGADGARMLEPVKDSALAAIVRHHHERVCGRGTPDGLVGEEIPLGARIVAVADAFDVLTSRGPRSRVKSQRQALAMLRAEAGVSFDRRAVEAFHECCSGRRSIFSFAFLTAVSERLTGALQLPGSLGSATTTGPAAQLLPALGAVGLLALAPGVVHRPGHGREAPVRAVHSSRSSSAERLAADARSDAPTSSARRGGRSDGGWHASAPGAHAPKARTAPTAAPQAPALTRDVQQPSSSSATEAVSASSTSTSSTATSDPPDDQPVEASGGSEEQTTSPPPPEQAAVVTPTITTPAISTPTISLPPVKLPVLEVPALTVPSVTVPPITLPGLKIPLGR